MTRLIFVSDSPSVWGAETSMLELAGGLVGIGETPEYYGPSAAVADEWRRRGGVARTIELPTGRPADLVRWRRRLVELAGGLGPSDTVVVFSLPLLGLAWLPWFRRRPVFVLDLHDYLPRRRGRGKLACAALAVRHTVAVSRFAASQLLPSAPRTVLTRPIGAPPEISGSVRVPTIGVVGRVDPDKRVELAVAAVAELSGVVLCVRGGPSQHAPAGYFESLLDLGRRTLGERFVYEGRVAREWAMSGLSALLVVNPAEAMGRTVLEAQLAGVPVVVPDSGGPGELVADRVTGYRYGVGASAGSVAEALSRALDDPARDAVVRAARAAAAGVVDPVDYARRYRDALPGVLEPEVTA